MTFIVYGEGSGTTTLLWNQCKAKHDICDVTIKFKGDESIKAHWCVLIQCPYFEALFESGLRETSTAVLTLDIVPADIAMLAMEFLYLHSIRVEQEQFADLIQLADYLQLESLKNGCVSCLDSWNVIDGKSCLEFLSVAETYGLEKLQVKAEKVLQSNFENVTKGPDILDTTADYLMMLMKKDVLKRTPRETFFDLLIRWVEKDEERKKDFPRLFASLDLKDVSASALDDIKANKYVKQNAKCRNLVAAHMKLIKKGKLDPTDANKDILLFTGMQGYDKDKKVHCYAFVVDDCHWTQFAYLPQIRSFPNNEYTHLGVVNGQAYMAATDLDLFPSHMSWFHDGDVGLRLVKLSPENVKKKWDDVSFDNADYETFRVHCFAETSDGGMVSVREDKDHKLKLKIDPPSFVKWCAEKGKTYTGDFSVPDDQKTSTSVELMKEFPKQANAPSWARMFLGNSLIVCHEDQIFIYLRFTNITAVIERCFLFNTSTQELTNCTRHVRGTNEDDDDGNEDDAMNASIAYMQGSTVCLQHYGGRTTYEFDIKKMTWKLNDNGLPKLRKKPTEYYLVKQGEDMYMLTLSGKKKTSVNTLYKLNPKKKEWVEVSKLPISPGLRMYEGAAMKVSKFKLCCPIDCRECDQHLYTNWNEMYFEIASRNNEPQEPHAPQ